MQKREVCEFRGSVLSWFRTNISWSRKNVLLNEMKFSWHWSSKRINIVGTSFLYTNKLTLLDVWGKFTLLAVDTSILRHHIRKINIVSFKAELNIFFWKWNYNLTVKTFLYWHNKKIVNHIAKLCKRLSSGCYANRTEFQYTIILY